ncbi:MAG: bifunctional diaminohydroxyphosphoribosylaminopyrimidine deaminase/5-amino-6-(5-phosphoribosylamino)uracil reductase RibD [Alphaproteobacteria bacterium]|nr:bifunctional diaminohydroxyphosphoribosylaminopyrimidine deaminase/5-amino-6-(5-phosphoribosylamino)uracil reductase RibD [Alphaproteobacteria bacterium]
MTKIAQTSSPDEVAEDERWVRQAIRIGRRGQGLVAPNPSVGCVLVLKGRLVARGWTQPGGRPHAEVVALARAGGLAKGCTAYVSLEPCAHHGRTPPCADALIAAGVVRVVTAAHDPDSRVDGRGLRRLRDAGIIVRDGVCRDEADADLSGFFGRVVHERPCVTLKLATTIDSRIATQDGESQWITGPPARRMVHAMRARHDAVLTGMGTVTADDPMLTCRISGLEGRSPTRVILDSRLSLPSTSALARSARDIKTMIITTSAAPYHPENVLEDLGVEVVRVQADQAGLVVPDAALKALADRGITSVLMETGARLATSFLAADLVDSLVWFRGPILIGGDGKPALEALGITALIAAPRLERIDVRVIGEDMVETYRRRL